MNSRLRRFVIYLLIFALFLPYFSLAGSLSPQKAKAATGDSSYCSISASYTVSNGIISINWSVNIKDKSITNYAVTLDQSDSGKTETITKSPYQRLVPNPDKDLMFTINVNSSDIPAGDGICVNQFQYIKGSTSGGGLFIPTPVDTCKAAPTAFTTTYQDTSTIPDGNVGIEVVWEGSKPGLTFDDSGTIYQDGKVLASNVSTHYAPLSGSPDPNKFYYKVNFPHTENHSWYVTQKVKGCAKAIQSNTVKYTWNGTSGTVDQGGATGAAGALGGNPQNYQNPSGGSDSCGCPSAISLNPLNWILSPLCNVMCVFIQALIAIMADSIQGWLTDAVK